MKQSNTVRRLWCAAWLGFVYFIYISIYSKLSELLSDLGKPVPFISTISIYTAISLLAVMIVLPPWRVEPSQKATTLYVIGALVVGLGFGLVGVLLPFFFAIYNIAGF